MCNTARSKDTGSDAIHAATDQIMSLIEQTIAAAETVATLVERERCATIVYEMSYEDTSARGYVNACMDIAAAIRNVGSIEGE